MRRVEDVWDQDLLHVTYDPQAITTETLLEKIRQEGFEGKVR